jgi:hypothetical protein
VGFRTTRKTAILFRATLSLARNQNILLKSLAKLRALTPALSQREREHRSAAMIASTNENNF